MTRQETEQYALTVMCSGHNCAESVLRTAVECLGIDSGGTPLRIATGFGGGVGRCKEELCGALAGGLMSLGLALGRDIAGTSADAACNAAAEFRRRFIELFGSSRCCDLLQAFGEQENWSACKRLVADTAGLLHDLAEESLPR